MNKSMTWVRASLGGMILAALTACGGGGGGDSPNKGNPETPQPSSAPGLQLSAQQVSMSAEHGDPEAVRTIEGVVNNASEPVYIYVRHTNRGVSNAWFNQTSTNGGRLTLQFRPAKSLTPGNYADTVTVDVCYDSYCTRPVTGSPKNISVNYVVTAAAPPSALMLSHDGVAFTKAPFGSRLHQQIVVTQSGAVQGRWTATTSASWLQTTPSGQPGDPLQLTADTQGLAPGQYMTWVTVQSDAPTNTRPAAIRVGLHVTETASSNVFANPLGDQVQIDPTRPYVYSLSSAGIAIDHLYTGQRLGTLAVPGRQLSEMRVSRNGNRILATDADNSRVWMFNTDSFGVEGSYALPPSLDSPMETRRTPVALKANGRNVMVVVGLSPDELRSGYYMVDLDTGMPLPGLFTAAFWSYDDLYVSPDGRHFMVHTRLSPNSLYWGTLNENSKGVIFQDTRTGGWFWGTGQYAYLQSDLIVGASPEDSFTCQGNLYQSNSEYVVVDKAWFDHVSWQNTQPDYVDTDYQKRCRGIERYEDELLLITDHLLSELQLRQRDGTLVRSWTNTSGLQGMLLSSDQLRVFDTRVMQDLPR